MMNGNNQPVLLAGQQILNQPSEADIKAHFDSLINNINSRRISKFVLGFPQRNELVTACYVGLNKLVCELLNINEIEFINIIISKRGLEALYNKNGPLGNVRYLYFQNCVITDEVCAVILQLVQGRFGLDNLLFSECEISQGAANLFACLMHDCGLVNFGITRNSFLGKEALYVKSLTSSFARQLITLKSLNLLGNNLGDQLIPLLEALSGNTNLQSIGLSANEMTEKCGSVLLTILPKTRISTIILSGNPLLGDSFLLGLTNCLASTKLQCLTYEYNEATSVSIAPFMKELTRLDNMRAVCIRGNSIDNLTFMYIADVYLRYATNLKMLNLPTASPLELDRYVTEAYKRCKSPRTKYICVLLSIVVHQRLRKAYCPAKLLTVDMIRLVHKTMPL